MKNTMVSLLLGLLVLGCAHQHAGVADTQPGPMIDPGTPVARPPVASPGPSFRERMAARMAGQNPYQVQAEIELKRQQQAYLHTLTELNRLKAHQALNQRTNVLQLGMAAEQVKAVWGNPLQTQFIADKTIWQYSLNQTYRPPMYYYLIFDGSPLSLKGWYTD
jgi:hypothetical protein